jgi:hypothetical protein
MLFLLFVFVFCGALESGQSIVPKLGEVVAEEGDPFGIEFVNAAGAIVTVAYKPRLLEDAEVLGNGRPGDRQPGRQFVDSARVAAQHFEDGQARRVAESGKAALSVSIHLP